MRGKAARTLVEIPGERRRTASAGGRSVFSGDLSEFGLVDIAQTMMMGRKTGLLTVRKGKRSGYLYFLEGEIVYVIDDEFQQGIQAALQVFIWKEGSFDFDFSKTPPGRNVTVSTENLLFEVARQIDEVQSTEDGPKRLRRVRRSGTMSHSLHERHMDQIRDVFAAIARKVMPEVTGGGRIAPRGSSVESWLKQLTPKTGDALFLIPGLTPKLKSGGTVRNLDGPKVDPESIDRFVRSCLDRTQQEVLRTERNLEILCEVGEAAPARLAISGEGRKKSIVAHILHKVPDLFAHVPEKPPFLKDFLEVERGLIVVAGGPASGKSRMVASLLRHRAEARGSLVFLLARSREFIFENSTGLVMQKALPKGSVEFAETLRVCLAQNPDLVALDGLGGPGVMEPVFRAASTGRTIVGCLEADSPQDAVNCAADFLERRRDTINRKLFAENLKSVLFLERCEPSGDEMLGFRAHYFVPDGRGERRIEVGAAGVTFGLGAVTDL
jgi:twitching motility protein PilT